MKCALLVFAILLLVACGGSGWVQPASVEVAGKLSREQSDTVYLYLMVELCPKIEEKFERYCSDNFIADTLRQTTLWHYGRDIDYQLTIVPPEE